MTDTRVRWSILFDDPARPSRAEAQVEPAYFSDLHLDQVFTAVFAGREEYDLAPFFYEHLDDEEVIRYRQDVFRDLERPAVLSCITIFADALREMRACRAQAAKLHHPHQQASWFVDTVDLYCGAVAALAEALGELDLHSLGLNRCRDYFVASVQSAAFAGLVAQTQQVKQALSGLNYTIQISGSRCTVAKYEGEDDYSARVLETFDRFKQGMVKDYRVGFEEPADMNHVETNVLDLVAKLYPEVFATLAAYVVTNEDFEDPTIRRFDREVQFYVAYLEYVKRFDGSGLSFCYPRVGRRTKEICATDTFDLALADKLRSEDMPVVTNDLSLTGPERIIVVSGPNQGGKTTFARTFGQLHHLAGIGYLVPGREARLYLYDELFVQFEREEDLANMSGKLEDDLLRIQEILAGATPESVVILNELFSSTTLQDAVFLGTKVMDRLIRTDVLAVFVTFVEELASLGPSTVSMASTIVPANPAERTFKVVRKPADGLAYALAIAEKYGVTYEELKRRVRS